MARRRQVPGRSTLDKDLGKFTYIEEAGQFVARSLVRPAAGLIFLVLAGLLATLYAGNSAGSIGIIAGATLGAYMAINIGANDVTNNVGAAVGAKAMTMLQALVIAAIFDAAGALLAGGEVVKTISSGIVQGSAMPSGPAFIWVMLSALLAAALSVNLATWLNAPISTTHAIVGGVLGAGVAAAGPSAISWSSIREITISWVFSPLISAVVAAGFLAFIYEFIAYRQDKIGAAVKWLPVLLGVMGGSFGAYLVFQALENVIDVSLGTALGAGLVIGVATWATTAPIIRRRARGLENRNQSLRKLFRLPLIFSAALLSFAHGANDVSNAIGPLSAIVHASSSSDLAQTVAIPLWVMTIGAFGISAGILLFGPRLIIIVGKQITRLNPIRAFCIALSAAVTVLVASAFGMPVSSTHIAIGSVFGVGFFREWYMQNSKRRAAYIAMKADENDVVKPKKQATPEEARRRYLVRRSHFLTIIAAWVITVPVAALLAAVLYRILALLSL
ncbi:MAG TPA: inorganic phosphate transporter [Ensifer sp.]|nr:inorganic phosphate transporter [Ensifer sp.]